MKIVLSFVFAILFLLPFVANAHGLYVSSEGGKLHANFSDRSPASCAVVTVVDGDGIVKLSEIPWMKKEYGRYRRVLRVCRNLLLSRRQAGTLPGSHGKKFYKELQKDSLTILVSVSQLALLSFVVVVFL